MTPNVKLLKRTLAKIEEVEKARIGGKKPKVYWDQKGFIHKTDCGTSMCFGGWGLFLSGKKKPESLCELFGIEPDTGLFHYKNTLPDLRRIVKKICEGKK